LPDKTKDIYKSPFPVERNSFAGSQLHEVTLKVKWHAGKIMHYSVARGWNIED
jgi:hypothetical protein